MTYIASNTSANSDVFKSNRAGMLDLLQRVQEYQQRTVAKSAQARGRFEKREQLLRASVCRFCSITARRLSSSPLWRGSGSIIPISTRAFREAASWPGSESYPAPGA